MQDVLHSIQLLVYRNGRLVFSGPPLPHNPLEVTVTRTFPGGRVVVRKYELSAPAAGSLELTLIAAAVSGLVILTVDDGEPARPQPAPPD